MAETVGYVCCDHCQGCGFRHDDPCELCGLETPPEKILTDRYAILVWEDGRWRQSGFNGEMTFSYKDAKWQSEGNGRVPGTKIKMARVVLEMEN